MLLLEKIRRKNQNLTISRRDPPTEFSEAITLDLFIETFSRLPAKSIARCRCVSKHWESTLLRKEFTDSYLTRSTSHPKLLLSCIKDGNMYFFSASHHQVQNSDYGTVVVVPNYHMKLKFDTQNNYGGGPRFCGSVNGLVCITNDNNAVQGVLKIVPSICNISTGQSLLTLPKVKTNKSIKFFEVVSFFGYDPVEKQFKILSMTHPRPRIGMPRISSEHQVLTLGVQNPSWRMVDTSMDHTPSPWSCGVCINGVLYYVARFSKDHFVIVCFDFSSEKFKVIEFEEGDDDMEFLRDTTLLNYNGKLGAFFVDGGDEKGLTGESRSFEMRVLEDPENVVWSKHVYELPCMWKADDELRFVGVTGTNEIVLVPYHISDPFYVFYYNTERKTVRGVEIGGMAAFKDCKIRVCADHVEDVKFQEMFNTYNLRSCKRS